MSNPSNSKHPTSPANATATAGPAPKDQTPHPLTTSPIAARSSSGITDATAQEAHDFMLSSTRRLSDAQSPRSPGLTDQLIRDTHVFWDSTATRRESHSRYLPDVTVPGMTDEVVEEALEFVEGVEEREG